MKLSDFGYELPADRIAQFPAGERDAARLLVHSRGEGSTEHALVRDLPRFLRAGDLLVLNDTRVRQARVFGRRASGGAVEFLLLERLPGERSLWRALANPARRLRSGERVPLEGGRLELLVLDRGRAADGTPDADLLVELLDPASTGLADEELLERHGHTPLPPYIERAVGSQPEAERDLDRERYQTVYARSLGAVAAPTAGLHFTPELLAGLERQGISAATLTLHVGLGTFQPMKSPDVRAHAMHAERYELPEATARAVAECRARGGRVVAVGTTSCRVLETCAGEDGRLEPGGGSTRLFLLPGHRFRVVDALFTNFHLPCSTLLVLVCALAGRERVLAIYRDAIERGYRFYSYGDATLILP